MSGLVFDPDAVLRALASHRVRFVLIGGLAASLHGSPVITFDLDVCYARDDENLERLAAALRELGAQLRGVDEPVPFQLNAKSLRNGDTFTFLTSAGAVDLLGTPSGTLGFSDLDAGAIEMVVAGGVVIRVASLDDLMRMKRASAREKDLIGLEWLGAVRDELERAEAGGEDPAAESGPRRSPPRS
jgi:hypothetical protein